MESRTSRWPSAVRLAVSSDDHFTRRRNETRLRLRTRIQQTCFGSRVIRHPGGTSGFVADNAWFPAESLSVTVLWNADVPVDVRTVLPRLARIALGVPTPR